MLNQGGPSKYKIVDNSAMLQSQHLMHMEICVLIQVEGDKVWSECQSRGSKDVFTQTTEQLTYFRVKNRAKINWFLKILSEGVI